MRLSRKRSQDHYSKASLKIPGQDQKWLSDLPEVPFTSADAGEAWGMTVESAKYRLGLLAASRLIEFRFLRNAVTGRIDGGLWRRT